MEENTSEEADDTDPPFVETTQFVILMVILAAVIGLVTILTIVIKRKRSTLIAQSVCTINFPLWPNFGQKEMKY